MRFLIILALSLYILSKLGGFFFRIGAASQRRNSPPRRPEGGIRVDSVPQKGKKGAIKGGDYVDFEEVK